MDADLEYLEDALRKLDSGKAAYTVQGDADYVSPKEMIQALARVVLELARRAEMNPYL